MRVTASAHASLPLDGIDLEPVRRLGARFPRADLREVAVVRAPELDARADAARRARVWLALEQLQATGSFKVRGALVALDRVRARLGAGAHVVAASAGNHGAGVAYAAHVLGLSATVVVPSGVPAAKRARMDRFGARIVLAATDSYDDAEAAAIDLARDTGASFVSPYDDEDVLAGNGGSLGFEIARALGKAPDVALAPFGGGGLATGLGHAFAADPARDRTVRPVWGVQSDASPAMERSLQGGEAVVRLAPTGPTLAEGLEGGISRRAFARAREAVAGVLVVSEDEIALAMTHARVEMGLVVEGSAAAALAPVLVGLPAALLGDGGIDVVVVLTGRNVDEEKLAAAASRARAARAP